MTAWLAIIAPAWIAGSILALLSAPLGCLVLWSLEFLLTEGLIHQLTSINAYVPCCHPRAQHTAAFLICEQCQRVQECSSLPVQEMMSFAEQDIGFTVARSVIELSGRCQACQ